MTAMPVQRQRSARLLGSSRPRWAGLWIKAIALLAVLIATPVGHTVIGQSLSFISCEDEEGEDDCEDDCSEDGTCPPACDSCACCAHVGAVLVMAALPAMSALFESFVTIPSVQPAERRLTGYRPPPFRPPTA